MKLWKVGKRLLHTVFSKVPVQEGCGFLLSEHVKERPGCRGEVRITVVESGQSRVVFQDRNLIVTLGRAYMAERISSTVNTAVISTLKMGTGGHVFGDVLTPIAPSTSDTGLETLAYTESINSTVYSPSGLNTTVTFRTTLEEPEGNGAGTVAYTEAGLFLSNGVMFARETFPAVVKTGSRRLIVEWSIIFG